MSRRRSLKSCEEGEKMGFQAVFSAPLVRSSFHAAEVFEKV